MTETNGEGQGSSNFAPAPVSTPSQAPTQAPAESERTFKQSEVNDLVGRAKSEAVDRYKRESSMASHNYQQPQQPQQQPYTPPAQYGNSYGQQQSQNQAMSADDVRRMAVEETQRLRNEWIQETHRTAQEQDAQRIASEFFTKLSTGKAAIADFDKVVGEVDLRSIPYHVQLANQVDNTAEVMYELAKNPSKIGAIQNLIDIDLRAGRSPKLALMEMQKLSQSLKDNAQASKFRSPNDPLSQLRPSNAGTGKHGDLSVGDYKRNPKYRV